MWSLELGTVLEFKGKIWWVVKGCVDDEPVLKMIYPLAERGVEIPIPREELTAITGPLLKIMESIIADLEISQSKERRCQQAMAEKVKRITALEQENQRLAGIVQNPDPSYA